MKLSKQRFQRPAYAPRKCITCQTLFTPRRAHAEACCALCSRIHAELKVLLAKLNPRSRDVWTVVVLEAARMAWVVSQRPVLRAVDRLNGVADPEADSGKGPGVGGR